MELMEWAERHLRSRDVFEKRIRQMEREGDSLLVRYQDRDVRVRAVPDLADLRLEEEADMIVTLNDKANVERLVDLWPLLAKREGLKIFFVDLRSGGKWVVAPHVHDKVADPQTLRQGLLALYESVDSDRKRYKA